MKKMMMMMIIIIIIITTPNKKAEIKIRDNKKEEHVLLDFAISADKNVMKEQGKTILKYKELAIDIQLMWSVKTKVISAIREISTISKSFRKYLSNVPGKNETKKLQKTAILGTAHILQEVLM
jgi:hypothetical protein